MTAANANASPIVIFPSPGCVASKPNTRVKPRCVVEDMRWQAFIATAGPQRSGVGLNELLGTKPMNNKERPNSGCWPRKKAKQAHSRLPDCSVKYAEGQPGNEAASNEQ